MNGECYTKFKEKINELLRMLDDLESAEPSIFPPCSTVECKRPKVARGLCAKCYRKRRKEICAENNVKNLRDIPKELPVDPRQGTLFSVFSQEEEEVQF